MVKLRLARLGRKKRPFYRVVAVDSRDRRDGAVIDKIGTYNPVCGASEVQTVIDHEKAIKWLLTGAQPSETVKSLFSTEGIMLKYDMIKRIKREFVDNKWKAVRDENGNLVRKFTDEEVEKAFTEWQKVQVAKKERIIAKKENKLSKKAKAKLAKESEGK
ncbi:MAG: 30S ribosomal protein S16 [Candidatus Delongbacteria bacterium]|nr:30S ribosomal protein S16 [Candidatus Delongbacteria bacterium]MBN2833573.1 30S ribosomal protein S16 [Candidatus Delongbacteria bacterium]